MGADRVTLDPNIPRSCQRGDGVRKMAYVDRKHAKAARRRHQRRNGSTLHIYRCQYCTFYHLAKQQPEASSE